MIRVLGLIIFMLIHFQGLAQSYFLRGKVVSSAETLAFASVGITSLGKGTLTNEKGVFVLENLPAGKCRLSISLVGYEKVEIWVQPQTQKEELIIQLNALNQNLNEVTISGTLNQISRAASPVPVEIYTQKFFQKNPTTNLFESVQMINGVLPTMNCNVCNTGDIHINGLDGPYTLVLIDGMPIVSSLSTVYGLMGIPNSMIEKIEVVKGPAATLYGSEAVGGLINVITKNAYSAPKFTADYFSTSYLEHNMDLGFSHKKERLSYMLSGNYFHFNNRVDLNQDNFTDITLQKRVSLFGKLQWDRGNNLYSSLAIRGLYEDRFGGEMQWEKAFRGGDSIYGESIYTKRYELIALHPFKVGKQDFRFQLSANFHDQNSVYGQTVYLGKQGTGFGQLLHNRNFGNRHKSLFGVAFRYQWYDDNTVATLNDRNLNAPSITLLPGIFAQDEWHLAANHTLLTGLRLDYNNNHGIIASPRLNWKFTPTKSTTMRLSAGNGFRVVNLFTEDHAALTGARTIVIEGDLAPEQSWNINLQINKWFNTSKGFLEIDGAIFYTWFGNKIIPDYDTDPNAIIYRNLSDYAVSQGVSLNTNMQFSSALKVNAGVTLMQVYTILRDSLDKTFKQDQIHAPRFSGVFGISYTFKRIWDITLDYTGQVYGPMRLPILPNDFRPEYSPWFTLQNLQATKRFSKSFELYAGVKNLFNFLPQNPIMRPQDPFDKNINDPLTNPNGYTFDPSYNYAPLMGRRAFIGLRYNLR
jgi:outer membrane receptor for ferrienterochelin and colicins